jgi:hypothetical protein
MPGSSTKHHAVGRHTDAHRHRATAPQPENKYFEIRRSSIQGRGAFATRRIRKGTRLIEYVGERITPEAADQRYQDDINVRHHTFLFSVDRKTVIDAAVDGNDARFINHSCDPNCEAVDDRRRIFIEAIRTIQPGEELTYDYQYERDEDYDAEWESHYVCQCGTAKCRGTILAPKKQKRPRKAATKRGATKAREARGKTRAAKDAGTRRGTR